MPGHGWEPPEPRSRWLIALPVAMVGLTGLSVWAGFHGVGIGGGETDYQKLVRAAWSPLAGGAFGGFVLLLLGLLVVLSTGRHRADALRPRDLAVVLLAVLALLSIAGGASATYSRTHPEQAEVAAARKVPVVDGLAPPTAAELTPDGASWELPSLGWQRSVAGDGAQVCAVVDDMARAQTGQPAGRDPYDASSCGYSVVDGMARTWVRSDLGAIEVSVDPYFGSADGS